MGRHRPQDEALIIVPTATHSSLSDVIETVSPLGLEPRTYGLKVRCSTN